MRVDWDDIAPEAVMGFVLLFIGSTLVGLWKLDPPPAPLMPCVGLLILGATVGVGVCVVRIVSALRAA